MKKLMETCTWITQNIQFCCSCKVAIFWLKCRCILTLCVYTCVFVSVSQNGACCYKELCSRAGESYPGVYLRRSVMTWLTLVILPSPSFPPIRLMQFRDVCQDHTRYPRHIYCIYSIFTKSWCLWEDHGPLGLSVPTSPFRDIEAG